MDRKGQQTWYWLGDSLDIVASVPEGETPRAGSWWLEFVASPGPGYAQPLRRLGIESDTLAEAVVDVERTQTVRVPVHVIAGTNVFRVRMVWPIGPAVRVGNDPRKLMVRISDVALRREETPDR
jgi:hypothetical protein